MEIGNKRLRRVRSYRRSHSDFPRSDDPCLLQIHYVKLRFYPKEGGCLELRQRMLRHQSNL